MRPWVIVAGDFVRTGGMDAANHALASWLARHGTETHLVAHRVADDLAAQPDVRVHRVPRPLGSHTLGFPLLDHAGRRVARALADRNPVVVANGGNCRAGNVTWLHYVHAAYAPRVADRPLRRVLAAGPRDKALRDERAVARRARVVIANSQLTWHHAVHLLGARPETTFFVHYGADAERFRPPSAGERAEARRALGWDDAAPVACFVGALGDRRKGFDTLFAAWAQLCAEATWDALVSPTRYEAYGLAVQEALCCGLPAVVSRAAGVVERIPEPMHDLLLHDPDDAAELAVRLRAWRGSMEAHRAAALALSAELRARTWDDMAQLMATLISHELP